MIKQLGLLLLPLLALGLAGCTVVSADGANSPPVLPTPTTNSIFGQTNTVVIAPTASAERAAAVPTVANYFVTHATSTPRPTSTPFPTAPAPTPDLARLRVITETIYDDRLNNSWSLLRNAGMDVDATESDVVHSGTRAIAMTPQQDYATLYFAVKDDAERAYPRDQVVGVTLWLNSGAEEVALDDLAVTVVGSNDFQHWVADDVSVQLDDISFFSESRLYYLGLNRSIPPNTWVEITVWLDQLPYEPDYEYVTGIYIKNDAGFRQTIYIDDVELVMWPDDSLPSPTEMPVDVSTDAADTTATATPAGESRSAVTTAVPTTTLSSPTAAPTAPPAPTAASDAPTPTTPTPEPVSTGTLTLDLWVLEGSGTCADGQWQQRVFIEGHGGSGTYTYFWNDTQLTDQPLRDEGHTFVVTGPAEGVVGSGKVISSDGQMLERELVVPPLGC